MEQILGSVPTLLFALVVLAVGWILAALMGRVVRAALSRIGISKRLAEWSGSSEGLGLEQLVGRIVFVVLMLFVLVGFFRVLGLSQISIPLREFLTAGVGYAPLIITPVLLAALGGGLRLALAHRFHPSIVDTPRLEP